MTSKGMCLEIVAFQVTKHDERSSNLRSQEENTHSFVLCFIRFGFLPIACLPGSELTVVFLLRIEDNSNQVSVYHLFTLLIVFLY